MKSSDDVGDGSDDDNGWTTVATVAVDGVDGLVCVFWQDGRYIWHGG